MLDCNARPMIDCVAQTDVRCVAPDDHTRLATLLRHGRNAAGTSIGGFAGSDPQFLWNPYDQTLLRRDLVAGHPGGLQPKHFAHMAHCDPLCWHRSSPTAKAKGADAKRASRDAAYPGDIIPGSTSTLHSLCGLPRRPALDQNLHLGLLGHIVRLSPHSVATGQPATVSAVERNCPGGTPDVDGLGGCGGWRWRQSLDHRRSRRWRLDGLGRLTRRDFLERFLNQSRRDPARLFRRQRTLGGPLALGRQI